MRQMTENRWGVLQQIADGASRDGFDLHWDHIPSDMKGHLDALVELGYVERNGSYIFPTRRGYRALGRWEMAQVAERTMLEVAGPPWTASDRMAELRRRMSKALRRSS